MRSTDFVRTVVSLDDLPGGGLPEAAFIGPSNVGKSSLINALVGQAGLARTSRTPGRTQALNFFRVEDRFHLVDMPGYGFARAPKHVQAAFRRLAEGYLGTAPLLVFVALLLDCRREPSERDLEVFRWLVQSDVRRAVVLTKADKLSRSELLRRVSAIAGGLATDQASLIPFSSVTGLGRKELWRAVEEAVASAPRAGRRSAGRTA